jgi:hypothetical protein
MHHAIIAEDNSKKTTGGQIVFALVEENDWEERNVWSYAPSGLQANGQC